MRPSLPLLCLLPVLHACAPSRGPVSGTEGVGESTLESAVFYVWDYGDYKQARLVLVDQPWTCAEFEVQGWWLDWSRMSDGVLWVQLDLYLGGTLETWAQDFESYWNFQQAGNWDMTSAHYFAGSHGDGGSNYYYGDDDVVVGREQLGWLAQDQAHAADLLEIRAATDERIRGTITSLDGEWSFNADHCGVQDNFSVPGDGEPVRPPEPAPAP